MGKGEQFKMYLDEHLNKRIAILQLLAEEIDEANLDKSRRKMLSILLEIRKIFVEFQSYLKKVRRPLVKNMKTDLEITVKYLDDVIRATKGLKTLAPGVKKTIINNIDRLREVLSLDRKELRDLIRDSRHFSNKLINNSADINL